MFVILSTDIDAGLAEAWFEYAGYKIRDAREPLDDVMHRVVWPAIREQLRTEGVRSGEKWPGLSTKYESWKIQRYPGEPMLRLTHDMEKALFDSRSYRVTSDSLVYRPNDEKVAWHQEGADRERNVLPQRTIVELITEDYEDIEGIFQNWLDELRTANIRRGNTLSSQPMPDWFIL